MGVFCCKCSSRLRLLLVRTGYGVLLCLIIICVRDLWTPRQMPSGKQPLRVNYLLLDQRNSSTRNPKDDLDHYWETEYQSRVQRVHVVCKQNKIFASKRKWNFASNRHLGNTTGCRTDVCPIIVSDHKLLFCFIPKVASTHIKKFFFNISDAPLKDASRNNSNAFHIMANDALMRVSPVYYPPTKLDRFYKIMFVRHPFDRLVSAFRSKAEKPRSEMGYFYSKFWDPIMKNLRPKGSNLDRITFREFVWYLTHTKEKYDIHWAPFWGRCDPCFVDYNFIGKLETAQRDFPYAFQQAGIEFNKKWFSEYPSTNRSVTLKYFASIPEDTIRKLFAIYRLDFELFGYSAHEFLSGNITDN